MIKNKVQIGGTEYKINRKNMPLVVDAKQCYGNIDYDNQIINICTMFPEQKQKQTLLHEILHGVIYDRSLKFDDEEFIVETLANALYPLFKEVI